MTKLGLYGSFDEPLIPLLDSAPGITWEYLDALPVAGTPMDALLIDAAQAQANQDWLAHATAPVIVLGDPPTNDFLPLYPSLPLDCLTLPLLEHTLRHAQYCQRQRQRAYHADLMQHIWDAVIGTDMDGTITYWNDAGEHVYGWTAAEALGKNVDDLLQTDAYNTTFDRDTIPTQLAREGVYEGEVWATHKDGALRRVSVRVVYLYDHRGNPIGRLGINRDITKLHEAEAKLAGYTTLLTQLPDAVSITDTSGELIYWNLASEALFGWTQTELIGRRLADVLQAEILSGETPEQVISAVMERGHWKGEMIEYAKDGTRLHLDATVVRLRDDAGETIGRIHIVRDITHLIESEAKLAGYTALLTQLPDAVGITDNSGELIYWNLASEDLYGYTHQELVGQQLPLLFKTQYVDGTTTAQVRDTVMEKGYWRGHLIQSNRNGDRLIIDSTIVRLTDNNGEIIGRIHINRDLTGLIETETKLAGYTSLLTELPDAVAIADTDGRVLYWNQAAETLYGYELAELQGTRAGEVFRSEILSGESYEQIVTQVEATGHWRGEVMEYAKDGRRLFIEASVIRLADDAGDTIGRMTINRDLTALRESEARLKLQAQIINQVPDAVTAANQAGALVLWNPAATATYGWSADEVLGKQVEDVFNSRFLSDSAEDVYDQYQREHHYFGEIEVTTKSGTPIIVASSNTILTDEDGNPTGRVAINRDITAQKAQEAQMRLQARIIEQVSDAVMVTDTDNRIVLWNEAAEKVYGWQANEVLGKRPQDFLNPRFPDGQDYETELQRILEEPYWQGEVFVETKAGQAITIYVSNSLLHDKAGQITGRVAISRDITEQRKQEEKLRFQSAVLDQMADAVVLVSRDTKITYVNPAAERQYGWQAEDILGKDVETVFEPQSLEGVTAEAAHQHLFEHGTWSGVDSVQTAFGHRIIVNTRISLLHDRQGEVIGWVNIDRDVTAQRQQEEQLRFQSTVIEQMADVVVLVNKDHQITYVNPAAESLYGWQAKDVMGKDILDVFDPIMLNGQSVEEVRTEFLEAGSWNGYIDVKTKSNDRVIIDSSITILHNQQGQVIGRVSIDRDVTAQRKQEELLRFQSAVIEQMSDAVVLMSNDNRITYVNPAAEKQYQWHARDVIGKDVLAVFEPVALDGSSVEQVRQKLFKEGHWQGLTELNGRDQSRLIVDSSITLIRNRAGDVIGRVSIDRDVTEQRKQEERLRFQSAVIEQMSDAVVLVSDDNTISYMNPAAEKQFEIEATAALGKEVVEVFDPIDLEGLSVQEVRQSISEHGYWHGVASIRTGTGKRIIIDDTMTVLRNNVGEIIGRVSINRDITEQRKQEEQLRFQSAVLDQMSDAVIVTRADNSLSYLNAAAEAQYGWKLAEVLGKDITVFKPVALDGVTVDDMRQATIETGKWQGLLAASMRDGTPLIIDSTITVLYDAQGNFAGRVSIDRDVTAQREQEKQQRFQATVLQQMTDAVILSDKDGIITYVNDAALAMFECQPADILGKKPHEFGKTEILNGQSYEEAFAELLAKGRWQGEARLELPNGKVRYASVVTSLLYDKDGNVVGRVNIDRNITELYEKDERMRLQATIIEQVSDAVSVVDNAGEIIFWNRAAEDLYGLSKDDVLGKPVTSPPFHLPKYEGDTTTDSIKAQLESTGQWSGRITQRTKTGDPIYVSSSLSQLRDPKGNVIGRIEIERNIAEERERERRLRVQSQVIEQVTDSVILTDLAGNITFWNYAAEQLYGYSRQEAIGKNVVELFDPSFESDTSLEQALTQLHETGNWQGEISDRTKDGTKIYIHSSVTTLRDPDGNAFARVEINRDITAEREARQQRQLRNTILAHISDAVVAVDTHNHITYFNEGAARLYGWTEPEAMGKNFGGLLQYQQLNPTLDSHALVESIKVGKIHRNEYTIQNKSGDQLIVDNTVQGLFDAKGEFIGAVIVNHDITEAKRLQQQLAYQANLLDQISDAVIGLDMRQRVTSWNRAAERTFGYKKAEAMGKPLTDLIASEWEVDGYDTDTVTRQVFNVGNWEGDVTRRDKYGYLLMVELKLSPMYDVNGKSIGYAEVNRDVTMQREIENKLFEQAHLLEMITDPIIAVDLTGRIIRWNIAAEHLYGWTKFELEDKHLDTLLQPQYVNKHITDEVVYQALMNDGNWQGEILHTTKSGEVRHMAVSQSAIIDAKGVLTGVISLVRDVTLQRETQQQLEYQANILSLVSDPIVATGEGGIINSWNPAAEKVFGYAASEAIGQNIYERFNIFKHNPNHPLEETRAILRAGKTWRGEIYNETKSGEVLTIDVVINPILDGDGNYMGTVSINRDVTEARRIQAQLAYQARLLGMISDAVIATDADGVITNWNQGAERIYGYPSQEAMGMRIDQLLKFEDLNPDYDPAAVVRQLKEKGYWRGEKTERHRAGNLIDVYASLSAIINERGEYTGVISVNRDITAIKASNRQLHFQASLLSQTTEPIIATDMEGKITYWNPAAVRMYGFSPEEALGIEINILLNTDNTGYRFGPILKEIAAYKDWTGAVHHTTKDLRVLDVETTISRLDDENVNMIGYLVYARDITEQKVVKARLEYQASLLAQVSDAIIGVDNDRIINSWNPAAERIFGYTQGEAIGRHIEHLLEIDDQRDDIDRESALDIAMEQGIWSGEARRRHKAGHLLEIEFSLSPIKDPQGEIIGLVSVNRDITERKAIQHQLEYQAQLIERVTDAIISTDPDFIIQSWNPGAEKTYGWRAEEVIGKPAEEILQTTHESINREDMVRMLEENGFFRSEVIQAKKDGTPMNVLASVTLLRDDHGKIIGTVGVNRDITERIEAEKRNIELINERTRVHTLRDFLDSARHDLGTPVTQIGTSLHLLGRTTSDEKQQRYVKKIDANLEKLRNLLEKMRRFIDITEEDGKDPRYKLGRVNDIVKNVLAGYAPRLQNYSLETDLDPNLPLTNIDVDYFRQMLDELIANALSYTPRGGTIGIRTHFDEKNIFVDVRDTGIGIREEDLPHIFDHFFRADTARSTETGGAGLGLTLAAQIAEMHGGRLTVTSNVGKGSTFRVVLPRVDNPSTETS